MVRLPPTDIGHAQPVAEGTHGTRATTARAQPATPGWRITPNRGLRSCRTVHRRKSGHLARRLRRVPLRPRSRPAESRPGRNGRSSDRNGQPQLRTVELAAGAGFGRNVPYSAPPPMPPTRLNTRTVPAEANC